MSEGPSTPLNGPDIANGSSPDDQLRLEAARKRLKIERASSESESPLDAQIRRMTKELEELKKQRKLVELQEQILAEQQLLEASRRRLSIAAASVSQKTSPAPASSTSAVSTTQAPRLAPQTPQPVTRPTIERNNTLPTPSPSVNRTPVPAQPANAVPPLVPSAQKQQQQREQQQKEQQQKEQQQKEQLQKEQQQSQQQQNQRPWFDRPRTPGAPADSSLQKLPPYQGRNRDEYTNFVSVLETHFAKAPQYYSKEREYRQVKLGLQHLVSAQRDTWYALPDRSDSWQSFRAFLLKEVVRNSKFMEQVRSTGTPQPSTPKVEKAQTLAAKPPPQARSNTPEVHTSPPAQQSQQVQSNGLVSNGPFSLLDGASPLGKISPAGAKVAAAADFDTYSHAQQIPQETVRKFAESLHGLGLFFNKNLSLHDRMSYLKKGVVPSIRNRAHRPFSYFKTYDEYVIYLQDIEDTLPQRQAELKGEGPPQSQFKTGSDWVPVPRHEKSKSQTSQQSPSAPRGRSPARTEKGQGNNQQSPQTPAGPGARSRTAPGHLPSRPESGPTSPKARKLVARRMSSPAPPEPNLNPTDGKDYWACRNFIRNLESHFREYHQYYTEDLKVAAGRRYIAPSLRGEWNAYAGKHPQMTWFDVCVFVLNQAAKNIKRADAARHYLHTNQKPNQSIRDYALWVQLYAPHCQRPGWNEIRHLWDRISPTIKKRARKDFQDFKDVATFVAYLEAVETTSPDRPKDHGSQNTLLPVPRKRGRVD